MTKMNLLDPFLVGTVPQDAAYWLAFRSALDRMHEAVIITDAYDIDAPGPRIVYANAANYARTGYLPEELVGQSPRIMQGAKSDRAALNRIREALIRKQRITEELINYNKAGEPYLVELDIAPVFDEQGKCTCFVSVQRDLTEQRRMQYELVRERDFNASIIQSSQTLFLAISADGRVMLANPAAQTMLGYSEEELIGQCALSVKFMSRKACVDLARVANAFTRTKQATSIESSVRTKSGGCVLIGWRATPVFKEDGALKYIFLSGADISAKRQLEKDKLEAENLLRTTNAVLDLRVKERTSDLAHLLQASQLINASLSLNIHELLEKVLEQLRAVASYSVGIVLTQHADSLGQFDVAYESSPKTDTVTPTVWQFDFERDSHMLPVVQALQPVIIENAHDDSPEAAAFRACYQANMNAAPTLVRSWMAAPMALRGELYGILVLQSDQLNAFDQTKVELVMTFVNHVAVSMENARLFAAERERRSEADRRRKVAEGLSDVVAALNTNQPLEKTLRLVLEQMSEVMGAAASAVLQALPDQLFRVQAEHNFSDSAMLPEMLELPFLQHKTEMNTLMYYTDLDKLRATLDKLYTPVPSRRTFYESWIQHGSLMHVPLYIKGEFHGVIALFYPYRHLFAPEDLDLAKMFANQAALAIDNDTLRHQAAQTAVTEERARVARELHDSVSQVLFGITLGTRTSLELLGKNPQNAREPMEYVLQLASAGIAEMRALIFALRPESLQEEGLFIAFERQVAALTARHNINVQTHLHGDEADVPLEVKEALYRIGLEAIQNTIKHARATTVDLTLNRLSNNVMQLELRDNGIGFDAGKDYLGNYGLKTMRERALKLGGDLYIESQEGAGTRTEAMIPFVPLHHAT